jgi:diadenosine tetraphosphate (Ap4A) HIT family hydrolase
MLRSVSDEATCVLCGLSDSNDGRYVWEDRLWRLWTRTTGKVPGYSFLNPRRHVPYITDLDGDEAATLGAVLAHVTSVLRFTTGASLVYLHVFGDGAGHFHIHLVPHTTGDTLSTQVVRDEAPDASVEALRDAAERIARALAET